MNGPLCLCAASLAAADPDKQAADVCRHTPMGATSRSACVLSDGLALVKHVGFYVKAAHTKQPVAYVMQRQKVVLDTKDIAKEILNAAPTASSRLQ